MCLFLPFLILALFAVPCVINSIKALNVLIILVFFFQLSLYLQQIETNTHFWEAVIKDLEIIETCSEVRIGFQGSLA